MLDCLQFAVKTEEPDWETGFQHEPQSSRDTNPLYQTSPNRETNHGSFLQGDIDLHVKKSVEREPYCENKDEPYLECVAGMLNEFRADGFLCDAILMSRDGALHAHSVVLAAASPVLRATIAANSAADMAHVIPCPQVDVALLEDALHVIYTGQFRPPEGILKVSRWDELVGFLREIDVKPREMERKRR